MKIISHRANLFGRDINRENNIQAIAECFAYDLDVEIDVWCENDKFFLGHDSPSYDSEVTEKFLLENKSKLWIHAKNFDALIKLKNYNVNFFWHQDDSYTLTSKGFVWAYPGKQTNKETVIVDLNLTNSKINTTNCFGICTDYPMALKVKILEK